MPLIHSQTPVPGAREFLPGRAWGSFILPSPGSSSEPNVYQAHNKQYRMQSSGKVQELSGGWSLKHPPCSLCPISPEGAIRTGQQVVEDIECSLISRASSHAQLLQKHRLWHSMEGMGKEGSARLSFSHPAEERIRHMGTSGCLLFSRCSTRGQITSGANPGRDQSHKEEDRPRSRRDPCCPT